MPLARIIKRLLIAFLAMAFAISTLGPWGLYWVGLYGANGRPELPTLSISQLEKEEIWRRARGSGEPNVISITPYEYIFANAFGDERKPGLLVAWWVASQYLLEHREQKGMSWWHLSGAALTIWLTRNWSTEQILAKAAKSSRFEQANPAFKGDALKRAP